MFKEKKKKKKKKTYLKEEVYFQFLLVYIMNEL